MAGLALCGDEFEAAFPFHLQLDAGGRLLSAGRSLFKLLPGLQPGDAIDAWLERRRPRDGLWQQRAGELCMLRTRTAAPVHLRGAIRPQADGSVLLLCAAMLTSTDQMQALGLEMADFALHDPMQDLLHIQQVMKMSLDDANRHAERVQQRTVELEAVLALSPSGMAYFSPEDELHLVNAALVELLRQPRSRLVGLSLQAFAELCNQQLDAQEAQRISAGQLRAAASPLQRRLLRLSDQRHVRLELSGSAAGGLLVCLDDVTRDYEVDRLKSEFLTTAAHELRTPMVSIFGFVELLMSRSFAPERQKEVLQIVHQQSQRLVTMVNELLDLARIEARRDLALAIAPQDAARLLATAAAALHLPAGSPCRLLPALPESPLALQADFDKTLQALGNVLSNAVKYSPQGGDIRLDAVAGSLPGPRPAVGLRVRDQGIGMSEAQLARVFERFYRADPSGSIPGTGLGMSVVRELLHLQGGEVQITSRPGEGTEVVLWLPAQP